MIICQHGIVALFCCALVLIPCLPAFGSADFTCGFDDIKELSVEGTGRSPFERSKDFVWPKGIIPYYFNGPVTNNDKALILRAMGQIETKTCFRFREERREPNKHQLEIQIATNSCITQDGHGLTRFKVEVTSYYLPKITLISKYQLADIWYCNHEGGLLHELMHVLGVMHTHKRKDRNETITINPKNIAKNSEYQYRVCEKCKIYKSIPYDCSSIMHYGTKTGANGKKPTMTAKDNNTCVLTASGPSFTGAQEATINDWNLLNIIAADVCSGDEVCPAENGFCVRPNGKDQKSGVIQLNAVDGNIGQQKAKCLAQCRAYQGATGCELIWYPGLRGCYVHTKVVDRGNGVADYACWIFSKCREPGCIDVKGCDEAFGKGELGICVPINKEGWNLEYKDIDFSAPMKTGFCKYKDDDSLGCCGCFKQKMDKCEDKKCVSIPKKKVYKECIKKGEVVTFNLFNTGRMCAGRKDCYCYQNCKQDKKCKQLGGHCFGTESPPGVNYEKRGPCGKKKKCHCYFKTFDY